LEELIDSLVLLVLLGNLFKEALVHVTPSLQALGVLKARLDLAMSQLHLFEISHESTLLSTNGNSRDKSLKLVGEVICSSVKIAEVDFYFIFTFDHTKCSVWYYALVTGLPVS
jgi:hypothetical protein